MTRSISPRARERERERERDPLLLQRLRGLALATCTPMASTSSASRQRGRREGEEEERISFRLAGACRPLLSRVSLSFFLKKNGGRLVPADNYLEERVRFPVFFRGKGGCLGRPRLGSHRPRNPPWSHIGKPGGMASRSPGLSQLPSPPLPPTPDTT